MPRLVSLAAMTCVVLSASLLLWAQPLPPPDDPFGVPAVPANNPPDDPFAPAPAAPIPPDDPFATPAVPATPVPAAAAPNVPKAKDGTPPIDKNWLADVASPSGIVFADESLGKEVLQKMTPAERMAYHLNRQASFRIYETKLHDLVEELSQKLQVNTELDMKALSEAAFDTATPIKWNMTHPANLGATLRRLLNSQSLDYLRLDDTLLITTRGAYEDKLFLKTYNLDREFFRPNAVGKFESQDDSHEEFGVRFCGFDPRAIAPRQAGDDDSLVDVIQLIKPQTWKANGGRGDLHLDLRKSLLVVNNTQDVHDEIEILLADLRKAARSHQQAIQANAQLERRVVFRLKLPEKQAGPAQQIGEGLGGTTIPLEPAFTMKEVADLIKQQVEPHTWKDEKHTITILGENLIINQSEAVQTKIHQFLHELGITRQQHDENNRPFYGFS